MAKSKEEKLIYFREYYQKNKEKFKKYSQTYKSKNYNKIKQVQHDNYLKNKNKRRIYAHNYHLENKNLILNKHKEYRLKNKDKINCIFKKYFHKRRVIKLNTQMENFKDIEIFERDGYVCGICGYGINKDITGRHPLAPSLDHIIPLSKGGTHTKDNVQCSHLSCNTKKGNKILPKIELIYGDTEFKW